MAIRKNTFCLGTPLEKFLATPLMTLFGLLAVAFFGLAIAGLLFIFMNPDCGYSTDEPEAGSSYIGCAHLFMFLIIFITPIFLCLAVMYTCYRGYCSKSYRKCCIPCIRCIGPGCSCLIEDSEQFTESLCWCFTAYWLCGWVQPCVWTCIAGEETLKTFFQSADYTYDDATIASDKDIINAAWSRYVTWPSCAQARYIRRLVKNTWRGPDFKLGGLKHDNIRVLEVWKLKSKKINAEYFNQLKFVPNVKPVDGLANQALSCQPILTTTEEVFEDCIDRYNKSMGIKPSKEVLLFHASPTENLKSIIIESFQLRPAAHGRRFGDGIYLAESFQKSDYYADVQKRRDDRLALFVVRASLGSICSHNGLQVPAHVNTVIGGIEPGDDFREFIVREDHHVVPEYVIIYKRTFDANYGWWFSIRSCFTSIIQVSYNWMMCLSRSCGECFNPGHDYECFHETLYGCMNCLYKCFLPRMATNKIGDTSIYDV